MPTIVFQTLLFAALGWLLGWLRGFQPVYDELEVRAPLVMQVSRAFETIHVPLWTVAILGLVLDLGILWKLLRARRFDAGWMWAWVVTAGVVVTGGFIVVSVFLTLTGPIISKGR